VKSESASGGSGAPAAAAGQGVHLGLPILFGAGLLGLLFVLRAVRREFNSP
jgi:hypothetical protein